MKYKIPFIKPSFPDASLLSGDYEKIVESNWFTNFGPFEKEFSKKSAEYVGRGIFATTVTNATLGLQVAVDALFDIAKPMIIMPSFTFAAGAQVLIAAGFTPVFIDIEEGSWQPSLKHAEEFIAQNQSKVGGILLCNIFGVGNANIKEWDRLASNSGLPLIIDTAAGFGSRYNDTEMVGQRGDCEIFSLHATKPFAVGEGGLVTSRNENLIQKLRKIENFGFNENREVQFIGTNAKMQELNAAIGLRQLEDYDVRLEKRRKVLQSYKDGLLGSGFSFQYNDQLSTVPFASIVADTEEIANRVYQNLQQALVEVRRYYVPLHSFEVIADKSQIADGGLQLTESIASRILSVPVHDNMAKIDINYIINIITQSN